MCTEPESCHLQAVETAFSANRHYYDITVGSSQFMITVLTPQQSFSYTIHDEMMTPGWQQHIQGALRKKRERKFLAGTRPFVSVSLTELRFLP